MGTVATFTQKVSFRYRFQKLVQRNLQFLNASERFCAGRNCHGEVISCGIGWRSGQAPKVTIMRKFGVAIFPDEKTASNGCRALKELGEGGAAVYASVVIVNSNGNISVLDRSGKGSHAAAIAAAFIGGLAGLPAGAACGRDGGGRWCFDRTFCRTYGSWS